MNVLELKFVICSLFNWKDLNIIQSVTFLILAQILKSFDLSAFLYFWRKNFWRIYAFTFGQIEAKPPSSQEIDCEKNDIRKHAQSAAVPNSQVAQKVNLSLKNQRRLNFTTILICTVFILNYIQQNYFST